MAEITTVAVEAKTEVQGITVNLSKNNESGEKTIRMNLTIVIRKNADGTFYHNFPDFAPEIQEEMKTVLIGW